MKNLAFVLGNGTSRKTINLTSLRSNGEIYGCNALYRDFDPDYLIAVDSKMVRELNNENYQHKVPVWTNPNKAYLKFTGFNFFAKSKGWSSGPTALHFASTNNCTDIYILGFDYVGLAGNKINNVYASTNNYKKSNDQATYHFNWLTQTATTVKSFPKINYIRVVNDDAFVPPELTKLPNLQHITVMQFNNSFNSA